MSEEVDAFFKLLLPVRGVSSYVLQEKDFEMLDSISDRHNHQVSWGSDPTEFIFEYLKDQNSMFHILEKDFLISDISIYFFEEVSELILPKEYYLAKNAQGDVIHYLRNRKLCLYSKYKNDFPEAQQYIARKNLPFRFLDNSTLDLYGYEHSPDEWRNFQNKFEGMFKEVIFNDEENRIPKSHRLEDKLPKNNE